MNHRTSGWCSATEWRTQGIVVSPFPVDLLSALKISFNFWCTASGLCRYNSFIKPEMIKTLSGESFCTQKSQTIFYSLLSFVTLYPNISLFICDHTCIKRTVEHVEF